MTICIGTMGGGTIEYGLRPCDITLTLAQISIADFDKTKPIIITGADDATKAELLKAIKRIYRRKK